jgi:class 3 adenylate cyclase
MAKFCSECGAPITTVTKPAEYKQVTVLFADVVHSMNIAAAVGPERLREIMTELVNRSAAVVQRYGGTVDKFTGDGIMAVFGAPAAMEDHAFRACLAALGAQQEVRRLADDVRRRDGVDLQLRIGLNSGQVIAGEIGSGALGYTTIGEQVGMAQRMESAAPPNGVMLTETTARQVQHAAVLGDPELVSIKDADAPVRGRRLLSLAAEPRQIRRPDTTLVGRQWEMNTVAGVLERSTTGRGGVVRIVGSAGIGKSRLVGETAAIANSQGIEVFSTFCESHASDIPFHVVARLLRVVAGVADLDDAAARAWIRSRVRDADPQDLVLFDDLLGIHDPHVELPRIDPDARRRRLTALINAVLLARTKPAVYIIEDMHWIDDVSESMLADFMAVIPQTTSMVLVTYRPEYTGALTRLHGAQTIALAPLDDSATSSLLGELLGPDSSVRGIAAMIMARAGGNPFFAQEIVRDLTERSVLQGERGAYACRANITEVSVPATLQATIASRIDRLPPQAKRTLNAAAVIGSRFDAEPLTALGVDPAFDELVQAELIDQVRFTTRAEYVFRHPLVRTVAYESQLKSDRAGLHRRLAAAIEADDPGSVHENAALIAEHLEAAGDLSDSYAWHMRAGTWATNRDIGAAHSSWERARQIADSLPADDPDRTRMRIAPRTMLCGSAWKAHTNISGDRFDELQELCTLADDKVSVAVGMTGLVMEHIVHARVREASRLASEHMALIESIGDPTLTVALSFAAILAKGQAGEWDDMLRWAEAVVELAGGDPTKGSLLVGSPLAIGLSWRGLARWASGRQGWREDFDRAIAIARSADPISHTVVLNVKYTPAIPFGVLVADEAAVREIEDAVQIAEESGDDFALASIRCALGLALVHRDAADRDRGLKCLAQFHDMCVQNRFFLSEAPVVDVYIAREQARRGDRDGAISLMSKAVADLNDRGQRGYLVSATAVLVEALLDRGGEGDVEEAESAIEGLAPASADGGFVARDIVVLRLRALIARARGDEMTFRDLVERHHAMATSLGFEGHIAWAEAMPRRPLNARRRTRRGDSPVR